MRLQGSSVQLFGARGLGVHLHCHEADCGARANGGGVELQRLVKVPRGGRSRRAGALSVLKFAANALQRKHLARVAL